MTRAEAVRAAAARLAAAGIETPELDARTLALEAFALALADLVAEGWAALSPQDAERFVGLVDRRAGGEPVDRIRGRREFWGLDFALSPATLSPRPDTETVVEAALAEAMERDRPLSILDLGTGSGCLLLALLSERPNAWGLGVDRAEAAAEAARRNAERLGLADRACFVVGDWAQALGGRFDLVVSNPPYIPSRDVEALDREVRNHDPRLALDGGADGLDAYRALVAALPALLAPGATAVLELGAGQLAAVPAIAETGGLRVVRAVADLGGVARAVALKAAVAPYG